MSVQSKNMEDSVSTDEKQEAELPTPATSPSPSTCYNTLLGRDRETNGTNCGLTPKNILMYWDSLTCPRKYAKYESYQFKSANITCLQRPCRRDWPTCTTFGDCCVHAVPSELSTPFPLKSKYVSCLAEPIKENRKTQTYYYFINICPAYSDDSIRQKCESLPNGFTDISLHVPVYSSVSKYNYKNRYCAQCHDQLGDIVDWERQINCSDIDVINVSSNKTEREAFAFFTRQNTCSVVYRPPPLAIFRRCDAPWHSLITECNTTGLWNQRYDFLDKACRIYSNIVYWNDTKVYFRNIFCAACNGFDLESMTFERLPYPPITYIQVPDNPSMTEPFSAIFHWSETGSHAMMSKYLYSSKGLGVAKHCPQWQVFDPYKSRCRRVVQKYGLEYLLLSEPGYCEQSQLDTVPAMYKSNFRSSLGALDNFIDSYDSVEVIPMYCGSNLEKDGLYVRLEVSTKLSLTEFEYRVGFYISWQNGCTRWTSSKDIALVADCRPVGSFSVTTFSPNTTRTDTPFREPLVTTFPIPTPVRRKTIPMLSGTKYLPTSFNLSSAPPPVGNQDISRSYNHIPVFKIFVVGDPDSLSNCTQIELNETEYIIDNATRIIFVPSWNTTYYPGEYVLIAKKVRVCVNFSNSYTEDTENVEQQLPVRNEDRIGIVLSYCSLTLSLLCLLMTFLVMLFKPSSKTIPKKIVLSLVLSLFTAQMLFLIGSDLTDHIWLCQMLGLLMHYSWLTVFFWQSVSAFHMYGLFLHPLTSAGQPSPFRWYCLYALLAPVAIISVYITVHFITRGDSLGIGYGYIICFLSRPIDIGLAFALPIGVILLINGYLFTRTVVAIRKMPRLPGNTSTGKENVRRTAAFVKMSLTLGFTWVFGYLANAIDTPWMWYIFIVLNGSLGVFIFIHEVCNRPTLNLIASKCGLRDAPSLV